MQREHPLLRDSGKKNRKSDLLWRMLSVRAGVLLQLPRHAEPRLPFWLHLGAWRQRMRNFDLNRASECFLQSEKLSIDFANLSNT